ncbi:hypothetical protein M2103_002482 [Ereboglobus sp. PH5-5]|uniref:hypothetical protein n=1 Tax=Ereboglobus sp. PH5-5 TaxID=2940529 RepID=UPI002406488A|nr:hypothetical protein [Ereboglobus sp. PH5-5]MDF9834240.1 hypothetical protein [Ereboglobus sp. PH5-5]
MPDIFGHARGFVAIQSGVGEFKETGKGAACGEASRRTRLERALFKRESAGRETCATRPAACDVSGFQVEGERGNRVSAVTQFGIIKVECIAKKWLLFVIIL